MDSIGTMRKAVVGLAAAALLGGASPAHARDLIPCGGETPAEAAPGWRVQVDPDTGIYSMPSPAADTAPRATAGRAASDLVVTPGTSPAGGYKIHLDDAAASHQEQQ